MANPGKFLMTLQWILVWQGVKIKMINNKSNCCVNHWHTLKCLVSYTKIFISQYIYTWPQGSCHDTPTGWKLGTWAAGGEAANPSQRPAPWLEPGKHRMYLGQQSFTLFLSVSGTYILAFKIISFSEQKQSSS